jgi:hypothetical protein
MLITLDRAWKRKGYTISRLYINGELFCNALEDEDRGLRQDQDLSTIKAKKIAGETAIPSGNYMVTLTYSPRFRKMLPLLNDVPGFSGVRIHSGNTAKDTEGCILVGQNLEKGKVLNSRAWYDKLLAKMHEAWAKKDHVVIDIQS